MQISITNKDKMQVKAPVIISASRATDIPAFYAEWFMHRLQAGYLIWVNPFNNLHLPISFENTRAIVFWTKNAAPMLKHLPDLDDRGINYYFTHTINDYEEEHLEPGVPPLTQRIETFKRLSDTIGKGKVIWRFDPLLLSKTISTEKLLDKIYRIGSLIHRHTEKLVISFIDIDGYKKVQRNLAASGFHDCREFSPDDMVTLAEGLQAMNKEWGISIGTCAETIDLSNYGIQHNKCIDGDLLIRLFSHDIKLMDFLGYPCKQPDKQRKAKKDSNQRKACGCAPSKDIGQYSTCMHLCAYCYANSSKETASLNYHRHLHSGKEGETIVPIP
ncbi:MAG: DUF1848 domain-containing protein [Nitrospirae bacterium]|nr:DUF1848 domain-containing protein [Nitrospirota bacterium]